MRKQAEKSGNTVKQYVCSTKNTLSNCGFSEKSFLNSLFQYLFCSDFVIKWKWTQFTCFPMVLIFSVWTTAVSSPYMNPNERAATASAAKAVAQTNNTSSSKAKSTVPPPSSTSRPINIQNTTENTVETKREESTVANKNSTIESKSRKKQPVKQFLKQPIKQPITQSTKQPIKQPLVNPVHQASSQIELSAKGFIELSPMQTVANWPIREYL